MDRLLIVLPPEEARNAYRTTIIIVVRRTVAAREVGHPFEQCAAATRRDPRSWTFRSTATAVTRGNRRIFLLQAVSIKQEFVLPGRLRCNGGSRLRHNGLLGNRLVRGSLPNHGRFRCLRGRGFFEFHGQIQRFSAGKIILTCNRQIACDRGFMPGYVSCSSRRGSRGCNGNRFGCHRRCGRSRWSS